MSLLDIEPPSSPSKTSETFGTTIRSQKQEFQPPFPIRSSLSLGVLGELGGSISSGLPL
jgi:hypothetical protein